MTQKKKGPLKLWWRGFRPKVVSLPIYFLARAIGRTLKVQTEGGEGVDAVEGAKIYAVWHGRTFLGTVFFRNKGLWTIISHSHDGMIQNKIFSRFGFNTVRGSTGHGGAAALVQCVKLLREGKSMAFTPDGPRGPSGIVQPGVMLMAKKSGAWIIPTACSTSHRWLFYSWDRYMIPRPFARALMVFGRPVRVAGDATADDLEMARRGLESEMHRLELMAEASFGHAAPTWHDAGAFKGP